MCVGFGSICLHSRSWDATYVGKRAQTSARQNPRRGGEGGAEGSVIPSGAPWSPRAPASLKPTTTTPYPLEAHAQTPQTHSLAHSRTHARTRLTFEEGPVDGVEGEDESRAELHPVLLRARAPRSRAFRA